MSFFIYPNKFDARHVYFGPSTQSTENYDNKFHRIMYSTQHISLNNLGFVTRLVPTKIIHHATPHKWIIHCDVEQPNNAEMIEQLCTIECAIIDKFMQSGLGKSRHCIYSLAEHLNSGCMKTHSHHDVHDHFSNHGVVTYDDDADNADDDDDADADDDNNDDDNNADDDNDDNDNNDDNDDDRECDMFAGCGAGAGAGCGAGCGAGSGSGAGCGAGAGFQLIVSIFGVWETQTECGLACKFTKW